MSDRIIHLRKKIHQLEEKIQETQNRLPAHSAKPGMMMELLDLEDDHLDLCRQLEKLLRTAHEEDGGV